ncbi:MAG: hypothetical protein ACERKZ_18555 [Lachnotalea sp.]
MKKQQKSYIMDLKAASREKDSYKIKRLEHFRGYDEERNQNGLL